MTVELATVMTSGILGGAGIVQLQKLDAADTGTYFACLDSASAVDFAILDNGGITTAGHITLAQNNRIYLDGVGQSDNIYATTGDIKFIHNNTQQLSVTTGGIVSARVGFGIGATQVVGAQGAAVANATDAADVITQLNALLARCRTHGLIAT